MGRGFDSLLKEGEIALCVICFTVTAGAMALSGVVSPPALDTSAATLSPPAVVRTVNDLSNILSNNPHWDALKQSESPCTHADKTHEAL